MRCPSRPDISGVYEKVQSDHYQRTGSDHSLVRTPEEENAMWSISDGTQYLAAAVDAALLPTEVKAWKCRGVTDGKMSLCAEMYVRKPPVQSAGCDECSEFPIVGDAYFCVTRHDFQLCPDCERIVIQPFPMVKVYTAAQGPEIIHYTCHLSPDLDSIPTYNFDPQVVHEGVTCSACQVSPIVGPRYKCAVRSDYELCGACEASTGIKGAHPHAMIKIYDPRHHPSRIEYMVRWGLHPMVVQVFEPLPLPGGEVAAEDLGEAALDPVYADGSELDPVYVDESALDPVGNVLTLRIGCATVPALNGLYALGCDGHYEAQGGSANTLIRHPVDGVWCVSDGTRFLALAMDEAEEPCAVREWKCFAPGKGLKKCADMRVTPA